MRSNRFSNIHRIWLWFENIIIVVMPLKLVIVSRCIVGELGEYLNIVKGCVMGEVGEYVK